VCKQACGKNGNGPYPIRWERSDDEAIKTLIEDLAITGEVPVTEAVAAVDRLPRSGVVRETLAWVQRQARVTGRATFSFAEIVGVIAEKVTAQRRWQAGGTYKLVAMTVQQAKNREFDGVVVLWPFAVGGDPEQKRRLLYNAMTRAQRWCTIIVQSDKLLQHPPFTSEGRSAVTQSTRSERESVEE